MKRISLLSATFWAMTCSAAPTLTELQNTFQKPEFVASRELGADGWPEARRRHLLKHYLAAKSIAFHETQSPRDKSRDFDKYRSVALHIAGNGTPLRVTLALWPGKSKLSETAFRAEQLKCDAALFSVLRQAGEPAVPRQAVQFLVTESCLDLTTQRAAQD